MCSKRGVQLSLLLTIAAKGGGRAHATGLGHPSLLDWTSCLDEVVSEQSFHSFTHSAVVE